MNLDSCHTQPVTLDGGGLKMLLTFANPPSGTLPRRLTHYGIYCKSVKLPVPGVGWWVKCFDVEPRGDQKVMSNSPSVPLGGAAAWETTWVCFDWSHQPIAMKWDTLGGDRGYSDWGPKNNHTGVPCFAIMSNFPSVPLGGAAAWETTWVCYDRSHQPFAMKWDTCGADRGYSDWGPENNNTGLPCFAIVINTMY